jgi:3-hydroxybutyrate dehydrogenase
MKTIIITGGTSGIGLNIANFFYEKNYNVAIAGISNQSALGKLKKKFDTDKSLILNLDLIKNNNIKKFVNLTKKKFNTIDVLVNCAGLQYVAPICKFSDKIWDYIININLKTPFKMTKEVLPIMRKNNWGRIINISSVHGAIASQFKAAYVSSKHGLVGLTKVVALETAKENITCNAIAPGFVDTELVKKQIKKLSKQKKISFQKASNSLIKEKHPSMNFVKKNDVSSLAFYLTTNEASQITGSNLIIDGGWTAQ